MRRKAKHCTIIVTVTLLNPRGVASREHVAYCSPKLQCWRPSLTKGRTQEAWDRPSFVKDAQCNKHKSCNKSFSRNQSSQE